MPEPKNLHVDAVLSNMSVQYRNAAMIWRNVMPVIPVVHRSDVYNVYNKADSFTLTDDSVTPKALPNEVDYGMGQDNYSVRDHALSDWLAQESIDNADNHLKPEVDTVEYLNLWLDIAQEQRVSNIVFNSASYAAGNSVTLSGTTQWGGTADDPLGDLLKAVESCFVRANTLVIGADAWIKLRSNAKVISAVKGKMGDGLVKPAELAELLEVENVLVGRGRYNTAKPGQTPAFARLWGKHCSALYVDPKPSLKSITFGATLSETDRIVYRDCDGKRGVKGAHFFKVAWNSAEKIIASDLGYFIQNAVA